MHSDACLPNTFIALSTPRARDPAESAGVDLAHPTSMINSALLRIGEGSLRNGTAIVFMDGIARCPRRTIESTRADWTTSFTGVNLRYATSVVCTDDK